jgi:hypothetical protein
MCLYAPICSKKRDTKNVSLREFEMQDGFGMFSEAAFKKVNAGMAVGLRGCLDTPQPTCPL